MKYILLTILGLIAISQSLLILPPVKTGSKTFGLIWIQGAQCDVELYRTILTEIQNQFAYPLWVAVPAFTFNTPEPAEIGSKINSALKELQKYGVQVGAVFHGGHSLGSVMVQDYLKNNSKTPSLGLILHGGFIQRKYVTLNSDGTNQIQFAIPAATIGGELDGLTRVSRLAESHYTQIMNSKQGHNFPVTVIKGVSHASFIEGTTPSFVKSHDLLPEVSLQVAHQQIAKASVAFMHQVLGMQVNQVDQYTVELLKPMIEALLLEGYNNFKPPCYDSDLVNKPSLTCQHGSTWTEIAQASLGGLENTPTTVKTDSNYHRVESVNPIHLPEVDSNCDGVHTCVMKTIAVVEARYDSLLSLDTGTAMLSASELKTKLVSRQNILSHNGQKVDFEVSDAPDLCGQANQKAIDWALKNLPKDTVARYQSYGQKLRIGKDLGPYNAGPLWIWTYIDYKEETDSSGKSVITVEAPMMKTPLDYWEKDAAGFHYCKLLSPAYAAEWIYVDGLRKYRSLKNSVALE